MNMPTDKKPNAKPAGTKEGVKQQAKPKDPKDEKIPEQVRLAPIDKNRVSDLIGEYIDSQEALDSAKEKMKDIKSNQKMILDDIKEVLSDDGLTATQALKKAFGIIEKKEESVKKD